MKKINIIKSNLKYNEMIEKIRPFKYKYFLIFIEENKETYHFGYSVSKKKCTAVKRNKIKRQLKDICDTQKYIQNFNCIIMTKNDILNKTYQEMYNDLIYCFNKLNIIKGDINEK